MKISVEIDDVWFAGVLFAFVNDSFEQKVVRAFSIFPFGLAIYVRLIPSLFVQFL